MGDNRAASLAFRPEPDEGYAESLVGLQRECHHEFKELVDRSVTGQRGNGLLSSLQPKALKVPPHRNGQPGPSQVISTSGQSLKRRGPSGSC